METNLFNNFHQVNHPLILDKLSRLRDKNTGYKEFRELVYSLSLLLAYEATANLKMTQIQIQTPLENCTVSALASPYPVILPILRAGLGMVDALLSVIPQASVGHIGLFRDEKTRKPQKYYFKTPENTEAAPYFVCDPMLATGGSAVCAINLLKEKNIKDITFLCLVSTPEGLKNFYHEHPDIPIYSAALDRELDSNSFIRPGLGDAGDRLFGTR
jgi:uracil phosphoribosyltransferase